MNTATCYNIHFDTVMDSHIFKCNFKSNFFFIKGLNSACLERTEFDIYIGNDKNIYSVDEDNHFLVDHKFLFMPRKILFLEIDYQKRLIFIDGKKKLNVLVNKKLLVGQNYPDTVVVKIDTLNLDDLPNCTLKFDSVTKKKRLFYLYSLKEIRMIDLTRDPLTEIKSYNFSKFIPEEDYILDFVPVFSYKRFYILSNQGIIYQINFKLKLENQLNLSLEHNNEKFNLIDKSLLENFLVVASSTNHEEKGDRLTERKIYCTSYLTLIKLKSKDLVITNKKKVLNSTTLGDRIEYLTFDSFLDKKNLYPLVTCFTKFDLNFFSYFVQKDNLVSSIKPQKLLSKHSSGGMISCARLAGMKFVLFTKNGFILIVRRKNPNNKKK